MSVLALSGCQVDVDVLVQVSRDGSGVVTVDVGVDEAVLAAAPGVLDQLRTADLRDAGWTVGTATVADDGLTWLEVSKGFADPAQAAAVLAELNGPGGPLGPATLTLVEQPDTTTWRFEGTAGLPGGLEAFSDPDLTAQLGATPLADLLAASGTTLDQALSLRVQVDLPVPLTSASVLPLQGSSAAWEPSMADGATTTLRAEAVEQHPRHDRWATVARVGAGVAVGLVVVEVGLWAWLRRRRHPPLS